MSHSVDGFRRVVAGDIEGLFWVIVVVVTVIVKAVNAVKRKAGSPARHVVRPGGPSKRPAAAPQQELTDFLRSLAEGLQIETPKPVPAAAPRRPAERVQTASPPPKRAAVKKTPAEATATAPTETDAYALRQPATEAGRDTVWLRRLYSLESARNAILLREILGPPVSVRAAEDAPGVMRRV